MSFWIMLLIACVSAFIGGIVNYLLPANAIGEKFVKPWWQCVILGFGATLLAPLFLELAQSKLLENIHFKFTWEKPLAIEVETRKVDTLIISTRYDSANKAQKIDTIRKKANSQVNKVNTEVITGNTGKNYFLWTAYCLLAAAAGFKFIDMLINKVVLAEQLNKEKGKNEVLTKTVTKQAKFAEDKQEKEEDEILKKISLENNVVENLEYKQRLQKINLPPIIHLEDPQKGRFGGLSQTNGRRLKVADVEELSTHPNRFKFKIVVETTNPDKRLMGNVIFYLHNSFYNSVRDAKVVNGIAEIQLKKVYGAFTVGAIADNGETLLELDLSEVKAFPKKFRDR